MGSLSAPGTLKILVIGAENLDTIVTFGEQQPYYIIECGKQRSRSKPCLNSSTSPHWNTAHKFDLFDETAAVAVIKDESTKGIIAEGLIDLSRARLTGRDAATAQLRNLAGQPAGLLRFKLKFQAAGPGDGDRLSPNALLQQQQLSDAGRSGSGLAEHGGYYGTQQYGGGQQYGGTQQYGDGLSRSRRGSEASSSLPRRISEAGSYRSTGSLEGHRARSMTPPGARSSLGGSRSSGAYGSGPHAARMGGGRAEEPDVVLAAATSKVSLAKQAMQQLTAELAELTGPGGGQSPSPAPPSSAGSQAAQASAFAAAAVQQAPLRGGSSSQLAHEASRGSSRQGSLGLNVLGQPVAQQPQPQPQNSSAWSDYRQAYQQTKQEERRLSSGMDPADSWNVVPGQDLPGGPQQQQQQQWVQQQQWAAQQQWAQQQSLPPDRRFPRISTGSMTPSGMLTPDMSPRAAAAYAAYAAAAAGGPGGVPSEALPPSWPRLRGVFGGEVLSTEELVTLYASSGHTSEKKLITLLEEALAAAHAEKVATEQELSNVKQAMASMSKQHYLDVKRLKEMTAAAGLALPPGPLGGGGAGGATGRPLTPSRFRNPDGTPPASPHGGMLSMVDTKPPRSGRQSRASDSSDLMGRELSSPIPRLTVATGRPGSSTSAAYPGASPTAAATAAAAAAAATGELASLRAEHNRVKATSAQLEQEVARLKGRAQQAEGLEAELQQLRTELQQLQEQQQQQQAEAAAGGGSSKHGAATAAAAGAVGAAAGGAVAAAAAAAELTALRDEHVRVRALAESLEEEVGALRDSQSKLEAAESQLEDLQVQHAGVKEALAATQQQLEQLRSQQQLKRSNSRSGSEWQDATEDFDSASSNGGSPMPAYKLQIQLHQLERQLAEAAAKTKEDEAKRERLAADMQELEDQLEEKTAAAKQAEENARAAEEKAANLATVAAAARAEAAEARASTASTSGKEGQLSAELEAALAEKAELETALGLLDRESKEQSDRLQAELARVQEELAGLKEGGSDVATLQAQLAAAREEASGLRSDNEEVDYLQGQLRRTLRQVVELQRQVQVLQQERGAEHQGGEQDHEAALDAAIRSEHEFLMQELVAAKLELAEVKEQQLITQRQLYKAQESMKHQGHLVTASSSSLQST